MTRTAEDLAAELARHHEALKEYAYPDPYSDLGKVTRSKRWGDMPAQEIFDQLGADVVALKPDPWTVGYGATGRDIGPTTRWTRLQAERDLQARLAKLLRQIRLELAVPLAAHQEAALVSFAYNVGMGRASTPTRTGRDGLLVLKSGRPSTLMRKTNAGDHKGAADQFLRWIQAGGVDSKGLYNRRIAERSMYLGTHPALRGTA